MSSWERAEEVAAIFHSRRDAHRTTISLLEAASSLLQPTDLDVIISLLPNYATLQELTADLQRLVSSLSKLAASCGSFAGATPVVGSLSSSLNALMGHVSSALQRQALAQQAQQALRQPLPPQTVAPAAAAAVPQKRPWSPPDQGSGGGGDGAGGAFAALPPKKRSHTKKKSPSASAAASSTCAAASEAGAGISGGAEAPRAARPSKKKVQREPTVSSLEAAAADADHKRFVAGTKQCWDDASLPNSQRKPPIIGEYTLDLYDTYCRMKKVGIWWNTHAWMRRKSGCHCSSCGVDMMMIIVCPPAAPSYRSSAATTW